MFASCSGSDFKFQVVATGAKDGGADATAVPPSTGGSAYGVDATVDPSGTGGSTGGNTGKTVDAAAILPGTDGATGGNAGGNVDAAVELPGTGGSAGGNVDAAVLLPDTDGATGGNGGGSVDAKVALPGTGGNAGGNADAFVELPGTGGSTGDRDALAPIDGVVSEDGGIDVPVVPVGPTMLLSAMAGGQTLLGEMYELPVSVSDPARTYLTFAGKPFIDDYRADGHSLVFNSADNKFYGILNAAGAYRTGVLYSFDPTTDAITFLKTLSNRQYAAAAGLGSDSFRFEKATGFFRTPLLSPDKKSIVVLAETAGVDWRGLLIHINLDPASPKYLAETVVYDFFQYEVNAGNYCESLRGSPSEMAWGKDAADADVVFMGRQGEAYTYDDASNLLRPNTCTQHGTAGGKPLYNINGRLLALKPADMTDLSRPWTYASAYTGFDPLLNLGRKIYWETKSKLPRWTTESVGGGIQSFYAGGATVGSGLNMGINTQCFRLEGLLPLDPNGKSLAFCSGLNGSTNPPDAPPSLFTLSNAGQLEIAVTLPSWYTANKMFNGISNSAGAGRIFVNGSDDDPECANRELYLARCMATPTIEEFSPTSFTRTQLVAGDEKTTGLDFWGDPAVGGSEDEPLVDRYIVWIGAQVEGASNTLNKYDRLTQATVSIKLDPANGAHPYGKLLDLGNGTAWGRIDRAPPSRKVSITHGLGGYAGGYGAPGSLRGTYLLDLATHAILSFHAHGGMDTASTELVKLEDGTLWDAASVGGYRSLFRIAPTTGMQTEVFFKEESWAYGDGDAYALAGRGKAALYLPLWSSNEAPTKSYANVTIACVRADIPTISAESDMFGATQTTFANAHRIVVGATYSSAHKAMIVATAKKGDADEGTFFEIDKDVADADLCKQKPVVTTLVGGLADVPSTKLLATKSGALYYGTESGLLMKLDPAATPKTSSIADLAAAAPVTSHVRGYLAEVATNMVAAVVYDYDANGTNVARRLVTVDLSSGATSTRDITAMIDEFEPYPGVLALN
jgi:hypothetical protein